MMTKKESIRLNIGVMFLVLAAMMVGGLYLVQEKAKEFAARKATALALKQADKDRAQARYSIDIQRYNSNKSACGIRKLVDLPTQRGLLETYKNAAKDPTLNPSAKKRNESRVKAQEKAIKNGQKVIDLFGTIPPDFNCKNLPKNPPAIPSG